MAVNYDIFTSILIQQQRNIMMIKMIGEYFIGLNILSFEQAEEILKVQGETPGTKFGEIAVKLGYLNQEDLDEYLKLRNSQ